MFVVEVSAIYQNLRFTGCILRITWSRFEVVWLDCSPEYRIRRVSNNLCNRSGGSAAALRGRALRRDYRALLAETKVPCLIVLGADDAYSSVDEAEAMHAAIPNSRLEVFLDIGHMPNLEEEDRFNRHLHELLELISWQRASSYAIRTRTTMESATACTILIRRGILQRRAETLECRNRTRQTLEGMEALSLCSESILSANHNVGVFGNASLPSNVTRTA